MNTQKGRFASLETQTASGASRVVGAVVRDALYYVAEGLRLELEGDHEKALRNYSAALGEDPLFIEAWTRQLWMLLYLDEPVEARVWADRALQSFPNDPDILSLKSLAQWRSGVNVEARELNDTALGMTRESGNVWLARGEMQVGADVKSAEACFTHAVRLSAVSGLAHLRSGDILLRNRKYAEAVPYFREATVRLPKSAWAWYGYGRAQRAVGRNDLARIAFERAYVLTPRDPRYKKALRAKRKTGFFRTLLNMLLGKNE